MNPDELLQQIKDLLQQYLQLGPGTPVAAEAQQLSDAIDSSAGGAQAPVPGSQMDPGMGADAGGPPPDMGPSPDMMAPQPGEPPANPTARTFGDANKSALPRLEARN